MRSEADIRRQAEARLRRWAFLLLNGSAWVGIGFGLYLYTRRVEVPYGWVDSAIIVMLLWAGVIVLHAARTAYVELREYVVHRAIENERSRYLRPEAYSEKPKRLEISDDGELVDWAAESPEVMQKAKYER